MKEENIKNGKEVFGRIRELQRDSHIAGIRASHIVMSVKDSCDLGDYLIDREKVNIITDMGTSKILGLEIITDEKKILKLARGN